MSTNLHLYGPKDEYGHESEFDLYQTPTEVSYACMAARSSEKIRDAYVTWLRSLWPDGSNDANVNDHVKRLDEFLSYPGCEWEAW